MKKALKIIGWTLLVLIGIPLIIALFVSKDFNYEAVIQINQPIDSVWLHTNSLSAMDKWAPWTKVDPNMKTTLTGIDGKVGASQSWESTHKDVGKGKQTITRIEAPKLFQTRLEFKEPYESEADGFIKLTPNGSGTEVVWGFKSVLPYPMNLMLLLPNDKMEKSFADGLAALKQLCEK